VLEQKGEVGGHRRSERKDQSEDHDKAGRLVVAGHGPRFAGGPG
jgi:hypothetical protein